MGIFFCSIKMIHKWNDLDKEWAQKSTNGSCFSGYVFLKYLEKLKKIAFNRIREILVLKKFTNKII